MTTIHTPPASTLSLPSDTEIDTTAMAPPRPIYLVVATALKPAMGIGLKGALPWPPLKKDMAFFRAVTSGAAGPGKRNAVIMGRKTWESIPRRFRPLRGRVNVVVTRDVGGFAEKAGGEVVAVAGLGEGVRWLEERAGELGDVFVIGGSQIYGAAVGGECAGPLRVLQTLVRRAGGAHIECDAFFPVELHERAEVHGWRRASGEEVSRWVDGKTVPGGDGEWEADGESGMEIRVVGWEKTP